MYMYMYMYNEYMNKFKTHCMIYYFNVAFNTQLFNAFHPFYLYL